MSAGLVIAFVAGGAANLYLAALLIRAGAKEVRRRQRDSRVVAELNRRRWVFAKQCQVIGGSGARR